MRGAGAAKRRSGGAAMAAVAAAWLGSGCAVGRVDVARPIDVQDRWYGHAYRQDGAPVSPLRVGIALSGTAERGRVHSAAVWASNGALFLGAAVGCALAATRTSGTTSAVLGGGAVAAAAGSGWLFSRADDRLAEAVRHHAAALGAGRASGARPATELVLPAIVLEF